MERLRHFDFIKLSSGKADNVADFFEQIIKPQFIHKEKIKELHRTLMNYVKLDSPTLFLRLYGSYSPDSYHRLRRGFLTEYPDKTRMVFCDNTFSMIFAGLKVAGVSISEKELADYLNQKQLICSFLTTSEENELSYYSPQNAIRVPLNNNGWYQAHIKPTGYGFGEISQKNLQEFFPNPDRSEWDATRIRKAQVDLSDIQKKILIAHFIRLVHPLNSFLVPKDKHIKYSGNKIGEETEVILYVKNYLKEEFKNEYEEFDEITLNHSFPDCNTSLSNLNWFDKQLFNNSIIKKNDKYSIQKTEKSVVTKSIISNSNVSNSNVFVNKNIEKKILYSYLVEGWSHRKIEIEILELDSPIRGGGFEAMKILHSYDVKGDKKSILKYNNIEDEYKNATGKYKIALELLKTNN